MYIKFNFLTSASCALLLLLLNTAMSQAQVNTNSIGGAFMVQNQNGPCLTQAERNFYQSEIVKNRTILQAAGKLQQRSNALVLFDWPIAGDANEQYSKVWAISNYFDHDPSTNSLQDYNCGTRTYDTSNGYDHAGVDIFTWPFSWKLMDEDRAHVIAAQEGQIVFKQDGNFDRSCDFNNNSWNAIFVEHSDGSVAWYGHFKNGSLTSKNVGDMVAQGEYLGVVGSSGNSTGPHLHFELYNNIGDLIDPYDGNCNATNPGQTWWADQKPYLNSGINAALTHSAFPDFGNCPQTEISYESTQFDPNDSVIFASYYSDQRSGTTSNHTLIDPNGNVHVSWQKDFDNDYYASWWVRTYNVSDLEGTWTYRVTYFGETVNHTFNVGVLGVEDQKEQSVSLYPNPAKTMINIDAAFPIQSIILYDLLGTKVVEKQQLFQQKTEIAVSHLSSGIYFTRVADAEGNYQLIKFIKE